MLKEFFSKPSPYERRVRSIEAALDDPRPDGILLEDPDTGERNLYITGSGQALGSTHPRTEECERLGCVIHSPSDHSMRDFPTLWRRDRGIMERTCPHGVGHPDPDDLAFHVRNGRQHEGVHGCDGCCFD